MPETLALDSKEIEKKFGYSFAVRNVSLRVGRGESVVLFGSNGAGKTTFLKMAAGLMRPTRGSLSVEGFDIGKQADEARRRIGFLSHNTFVYKDLSPLENLKFFCRLYGVPDSEERLIDLLDRVGLRGRASEPVRAFSRGLQQRVGIARALLHDPSVILLDEPYTGLDAKAAQTLNGMLDEALAAGKTIVLTTHDLDQGLRAATRALILDRGNVVYDGSAKDTGVREAYLRYIQQGNTK
jgi:heme ABC exporter ATP-binding subunit CcmA